MRKYGMLLAHFYNTYTVQAQRAIADDIQFSKLTITTIEEYQSKARTILCIVNILLLVK